MLPETDPPPAAARPLLVAALCLVAGSAAAVAWPPLAGWSALGLAALSGAWCAHLRGDARDPGAGDRRGLSAASWPGPGVRRCHLALGAVFLFGALRAAPAPDPGGRDGPDAPAASAMSGRAPVFDAHGTPRAPLPHEGRWSQARAGSEHQWGTVGASSLSYRLPAGLIADGERVRILPGSAARVPARGPVPPASGPAPVRRDLRADEVVRLELSDAGPSPFRALRAELLRRADTLVEPRARGLARALVSGDTSGLDPADSDLFVRTGLRHLLAVSGMHVAWVALLFAAPLGWLVGWLVGWLTGPVRGGPARADRRALVAAGVAIVCVLAYAELTGGAAPVRRAATAAALVFAAPLVRLDGRVRGRRADGATLWSLALLLECLVDPRAPTQLSVQLSYAATLGLLVATRPLASWLSHSLGGFGAHHAADRTGFAVPLGRVLGRGLARGLVLAVAASCSAVLATLPIVWTHFGECSPVGLLATPLVAPWVALLLAAGWLVVLSAGALPGAVFSRPARGLLEFLEYLDQLPGTPVPLPERPVAVLVCAVALVFLAVHTRHARLGQRLASGAALVWGLILLPWEPAPARLELHALDVGHGSALVLRAPGLGCWIFDAGSRDRSGVARGALAPLLARWEVGRPGVVLSHGDTDHASALGWLLERYPPHTWAGALPAPLGERLPHTARHLDLEHGRLRLPTPAGGTALLTLLRGRAQPGNEGSRSLVVQAGGEVALLCGDAEGEGLGDLLRAGLVQGPSRLLLLPHHGSDSPWLGRLLAAAGPSEVWVSAGERPAVASELERRGLNWRSTAAAGPLSLTLAPGPPDSGPRAASLAWSSLTRAP